MLFRRNDGNFHFEFLKQYLDIFEPDYCYVTAWNYWAASGTILVFCFILEVEGFNWDAKTIPSFLATVRKDKRFNEKSMRLPILDSVINMAHNWESAIV